MHEIFDTHIHIWNLNQSAYSWLKTADPVLQRDYTLEDLEEDRKAAGVTAGILVQAENSFTDTEWMLGQARSHSWIRGVVGWLPLTDPSQTGKILEQKWAKEPLLKGVRHLIHDESDPRWLLQSEVIRSLEILASHDIPFDVVGVLPEHIDTAIEVSRRVPGLRMVFDHMNQPPIVAEEKFGRWGEKMKLAAERENFHVKLSGLGATAGRELFTVARIRPYVRFILEHFGKERMFCGGDWPVALLGKDYTTTWNIYRRALINLLPEKDCERILFDNAENFYL